MEKIMSIKEFEERVRQYVRNALPYELKGSRVYVTRLEVGEGETRMAVLVIRPWSGVISGFCLHDFYNLMESSAMKRITVTKEGFRDYIFYTTLTAPGSANYLEANQISVQVRKKEDQDDTRPYVSTAVYYDRAEMKEIEAVEETDCIEENHVHVGAGNKWKYLLADIVSRNFRCKHFMYGIANIVFYGYKEDTKIAAMIFDFLFKAGNKSAANYYQKKRKDAIKRQESFNLLGSNSPQLAA